MVEAQSARGAAVACCFKDLQVGLLSVVQSLSQAHIEWMPDYSKAHRCPRPLELRYAAGVRTSRGLRRLRSLIESAASPVAGRVGERRKPRRADHIRVRAKHLLSSSRISSISLDSLFIDPITVVRA